MEPVFTGYMRIADAEALSRGETVRVWLHPQENVIEMSIPVTWVRGREGSFLLIGRPPRGPEQEPGLADEALMVLAEAQTVRGRLVDAVQRLGESNRVPREVEDRMRETYMAIGQDIDRLRLQSDPDVQANLIGELRGRLQVARNFIRLGDEPENDGTGE